ncbi:MAG: EutN/CcmL family microcompartment protein [Clostridia bacterium]|nr:EutN/CcmL family microcompartment protein [Clostridia bacterium]MBR6720485.1 EutN/CcmL family microcompartment protein [Clostridia bacterium]MDO5477999.1 EutN/CcmL family microcompartment protein [Clostridia bacterium]
MIIAKVVGSIVSTRKNDNLVGSKFMVVEPALGKAQPSERFVAVDNVGCGIGETVLIATGSAARIGCGKESSPIDAAIVGIVDSGTELEF